MPKLEIQDTPDDHLRRVAGKHGIEVPNDRGERLLQFCFKENFTITNKTIENWEKGYILQVEGDYLIFFRGFEQSGKMAQEKLKIELIINIQLRIENLYQFYINKNLILINKNLILKQLRLIDVQYNILYYYTSKI